MATVHVTHDVFNRRERHVDVWRVVHHQHDACDDLQRQCECQDNAPNPHPVEVLRCWDHQRPMQQSDNRKTLFDAFCEIAFWFVMVVGNTSHDLISLTELNC